MENVKGAGKTARKRGTPGDQRHRVSTSMSSNKPLCRAISLVPSVPENSQPRLYGSTMHNTSAGDSHSDVQRRRRKQHRSDSLVEFRSPKLNSTRSIIRQNLQAGRISDFDRGRRGSTGGYGVDTRTYSSMVGEINARTSGSYSLHKACFDSRLWVASVQVPLLDFRAIQQ